MYDELKKRLLATKHPTMHRQSRRNETQNYELRKKLLSARNLDAKHQVRFNGGKRPRQKNIYEASNTGVCIDNNDIVNSSLMSENIRILGDIPYDDSPLL